MLWHIHIDDIWRLRLVRGDYHFISAIGDTLKPKVVVFVYPPVARDRILGAPALGFDRLPTMAIGAVSADHQVGESTIERVFGPEVAGSVVARRIAASALGEAREELRVLPSEIATGQITPMGVVAGNRGELQIFVDLVLRRGVMAGLLGRLAGRVMADRRLGPAWNETGAPRWIALDAEDAWGARAAQMIRLGMGTPNH